MKKQKIISIIIIIVILVGVCILVPILLEFLVWRNTFISAISNSDWSGFLGSYLGGVIGGTATLFALLFTLSETKKENHKEKLTSIVNTSTEFVVSVEKMTDCVKCLSAINQQIDSKENALNQIEENMNSKVPSTPLAAASIASDQGRYQQELDRKVSEKNNLIEKMEGLHFSISHLALIIDINLSDLKLASALLNSITCISSSVETYYKKLAQNEFAVQEPMCIATTQIQERIKEFSKKYKEKHIL